MKAFRLATLSFSRHRFSTFITVLAIALSVAASGILYRVYKTSEARFDSLATGSDALIGAKAGGIEMVLNALGGEGEYPAFFPYTLFQTLQAQTALTFPTEGRVAPAKLKSATPLLIFAIYENARVIGTDETFLQSRSQRASYALESGTWAKSAGEVTLGSEIAALKGLKVGDTISVAPWVGGEPIRVEHPLKVSGVLARTKTQWDRTLFSSITEAHSVLERYEPLFRARSIWGAKVLNFALINVEPENFKSLQSLINQRSVAQIVRVQDVSNQLRDLGGVGADLGLLVTSFVLILGALAVVSTLATRFEGMSAQIAVLRAIGYRKRELVQWLLWEGLFLASSGILAGACLDGLLFPHFLKLGGGKRLVPVSTRTSVS